MIGKLKSWWKNKHFHEWRVAATSDIYQIYTGLGHRNNLPASMNFLVNEYRDKLIEYGFFTANGLDEHLKNWKRWWYSPAEVNVCIICGKIKDNIQEAKAEGINYYKYVWDMKYKSYLETQKAKKIYKESKNENDSSESV